MVMMMIDKMFFFVASILTLCMSWVTPAVAAWTPLIDSAAFTGIQTDVSTAVAGIITIALIILGAALLMRAIK